VAFEVRFIVSCLDVVHDPIIDDHLYCALSSGLLFVDGFDVLATYNFSAIGDPE